MLESRTAQIKVRYDMESNKTPLASETSRAIIVGAGPSGMATAVALKKLGVDTLLLDENNEFAHAWKQHYQSLKLNSVRSFSGLPYMKMPKSFPRYPSRDQVISYLEDYAKAFALKPQWGEKVTRIEREGNVWNVRTNVGVYRTANVILATGACRTPKIPQIPGADSFSGTVFHSQEFKSGAVFRGQRVLVVGAGNSAGDIAMDLLEHKAKPSLSIRHPVYITPLDLFNVLPAHTTSLLLGKLPIAAADLIGSITLRLVVGDLSKYGIKRPKKGPLRALIEDQRVPMFDRGILRVIKNGELTVRPGIHSINGAQVSFTDGTNQEFEAIIYATGYAASLSSLLVSDAGNLNAAGIPTTDNNRLESGLYFVGFRESTRGFLNDINLHARWVAREIAA